LEIGRSHSAVDGIDGTGGTLCFDVDAERLFLNRQLLVDVLGLLSSTPSSSTCTPLSLAFLPMLLKLRRRIMADRVGEGDDGNGVAASSKWSIAAASVTLS